VNERTAVTLGALVGALVGGFASYLFFTERGRGLRERLGPALEDLQQEVSRFQGTIEHVGRVANEGMRAFQEFQTARVQSQFPGDGTAH
jgi:gas vesicle protein